MIVQYVYYAAKNARERRTSSRRRKRGLIQAAAAVGEQYLREYDNLNPETSHTVAVDGERVPTVHSAPSALFLLCNETHNPGSEDYCVPVQSHHMIRTV